MVSNTTTVDTGQLLLVDNQIQKQYEATCKAVFGNDQKKQVATQSSYNKAKQRWTGRKKSNRTSSSHPSPLAKGKAKTRPLRMMMVTITE